MNKQLSLFEASGVELEYMIVDTKTLNVRPIADELFTALTGEPLDEIERGDVSLNNELALHVVEMKTTRPAPKLQPLPASFQAEVRELNAVLARMGACLMPTAMHPWMDSLTEMRLWPHGNKTIYDTLHRIFDCRGHGWANLQSTHLNLPFGNEAEFVRLHSAIRLLLPLIPTLAASSPYADGRFTGNKDFRISTYRKNQKRIFSITGHVIPEAVNSFDDYHKLILGKVYDDLAAYDPDGVLRFEWVNSRGAITRFDRNAIEIRLIDNQECPKMDCAILALVTALLKVLTDERWGTLAQYDALPCEKLRAILDRTEVEAEEAVIDYPEYTRLLGWTQPRPPKARELWQHLLATSLRPDAAFQNDIQFIIEHGTLATRLHKRLGNAPTKDELRATYSELCTGLQEGRAFKP